MMRKTTPIADPSAANAPISPKLKRLAIYGVLFPPIVWLFMCAVNRVPPFDGTLFGFFSSAAVAYVIGILPALATGFAHNLFKEKGYRSILSVLVALLMTPLAFSLFVDEYRQAFTIAIAGMVAAMCCWVVSRLGAKSRS